MDSNLICNIKKNNTGWCVPYHILLAVLIFVLVNSITIFNVRGVCDQEGYRWDSTRYIPINTYEDDGRYSVYSALGYKGFSERHEHLINLGGPYVHIARFLLGIAGKIGIVKIFSSPYTYYFHPEEYLKIWEFIGLYKVWVFLIWLPIVVYWIGKRHFSEITGTLAAWFVAAIPFITGFEVRIKSDSVAIVLGLFSILWQLEYTRNHKRGYLFLAAAFLGISLAVKFNLPSAILTLLFSYLIVIRKEGQNLKNYKTWQSLCYAVLIFIIIFIVGNPYVIGRLVAYLKMLLGQIAVFHKGKSVLDIGQIFYSIWYRLIHFDSHFGPVLNLLVIPALVFASIRLIINKNHQRISNAVLLIALAGVIACTAAVVRDAVIFLTYYYYAPAILLLFFISDLLATTWEKAVAVGRFAPSLIGAVIIFTIGSTAYENYHVFNYMTSKTNRQEMYSWIDRNIPTGSSVGIPMAPTYTFFNTWIRLDPFKYRLVHIGNQANLLDKNQPDYFIWIIFSPDSQKVDNSNYKLIREFAKGINLPHERYDLYQEEVFQLYKRINTNADTSARNILGEMECKLGTLMRADTEDEFRILQFQSISFMPIWLNLMRKEKQTLQYDSNVSFESSIRGDEPVYTKYAYIHQIGPTILQLWGVKYIMAKMNMGEDSPFEKHVLNSARYNLKEVQRYKTVFIDEKKDIGLFYNNEYLGQIFFVQYEDNHRQSALRKSKKIETQGILYDVDGIKSIGTDNIAIFIKLKTSVPASVTIRGGGQGENDESWNVGVGVQTIWMPYRIFNHDEPIKYEINPLKDKGKISVRKIYVQPFVLYGKPVVKDVKITTHGGSTTVCANTAGEVVFSLPYEKYWRAKVDKVAVPVKRGLAGTIAVAVPKGKHLVAVYFK